MADGTFATVLNCMDGRTQEPVIQWIKAHFKDKHIDYVDTITEPGIDSVIAKNKKKQSLLEKIKISTNQHGSSIIVIVGHAECAGNPVSKKQHQKDIKQAVRVLTKWNPSKPCTILGIWTEKNGNNEQWTITLIDQKEIM